jgi:hypothetical protein
MRYLNRRVVVLVAHLRGRHSIAAAAAQLSQAKKIKPLLSSTDYSDSVHFQLPAKIHANKKDKNNTTSVLQEEEVLGISHRALLC